MNTAQAETDLLALLDDMATRTTDPDQARRDYARRLVGIMADFNRSVRLAPNATVATTGSAAAQAGTADLTTVRLT